MGRRSLPGPPLPVVHSLVAPGALRALVETEYDLGAPLECHLWHAGVTETYRVETVGGVLPAPLPRRLAHRRRGGRARRPAGA